MKKKLNVLFAAYEAVPFIKTGGLGDVAGSLPAALNGEELDVRGVLPKLAQIPQQYVQDMQSCIRIYSLKQIFPYGQ